MRRPQSTKVESTRARRASRLPLTASGAFSQQPQGRSPPHGRTKAQTGQRTPPDTSPYSALGVRRIERRRACRNVTNAGTAQTPGPGASLTGLVFFRPAPRAAPADRHDRGTVRPMLLLTYLFPIGVLAVIGHYYFRLYRQGKAAGVGMMAILQAATHEQLAPPLSRWLRRSVSGLLTSSGRSQSVCAVLRNRLPEYVLAVGAP